MAVPTAPCSTRGTAARPPSGRTVLDARDISRALRRIAHEILERNKGADDLVLLGIPTRGVPLAQPARRPRSRRSRAPRSPVGSARHHHAPRRPAPQPTRGPTTPRSRPAASTARSSSSSTTCSTPAAPIRAALDALTDLGRPARVRLAVLVDRGHRELPIRADHVGKNLPDAPRRAGAACASPSSTASTRSAIATRGRSAR